MCNFSADIAFTLIYCEEFEKIWSVLTPIQSSSSATFRPYDLEQDTYILLEAYIGLSVDSICLT